MLARCLLLALVPVCGCTPGLLYTLDHDRNLGPVAFTSGDSELVVSEAGQTLAIWDLSKRVQTAKLDGSAVHHGVGIDPLVSVLHRSRFAVASDGKTLIQLLGEPGAAAWSRSPTGWSAPKDRVGVGLTSVAAVGSAWAFAAAGGDRVALGPLDGLEWVPLAVPEGQAPEPTGMATVAASPRGDVVAAGSLDGRVFLVDVATRKQLWGVDVHEGWVLGLVVTEDAVISGDRAGTIVVLSRADGHLLQRWDHGSKLNAVAAHPDVPVVFSAGVDGWLVGWTVGESSPTHEVRLHGGESVMGLAFSSDGKRLATAGADEAVWVFDVARLCAKD